MSAKKPAWHVKNGYEESWRNGTSDKQPTRHVNNGYEEARRNGTRVKQSERNVKNGQPSTSILIIWTKATRLSILVGLVNFFCSFLVTYYYRIDMNLVPLFIYLYVYILNGLRSSQRIICAIRVSNNIWPHIKNGIVVTSTFEIKIGTSLIFHNFLGVLDSAAYFWLRHYAHLCYKGESRAS